MRQLDTCDFCGDAPEGVYEVVPASVAGDPKRLALCAACRETLQSVVDPLLDAANAAASAEPDEHSRPVDQAAQAAGADSGTAVDDAMDGDAERASDANAAESTAGSAASADADDGVTIDASEGSDESDSIADASGADAGEDTDDAEAADAGEAAAGGSPARRPDGYAQVVRLLQNRDGAMPRDDLRALATNAYDLSGREFEAALEAAVENGDVEETSSGLRTA